MRRSEPLPRFELRARWEVCIFNLKHKTHRRKFSVLTLVFIEYIYAVKNVEPIRTD